MEKIGMLTPLVEMDGDEMAAILWKETKEKLILPFVDLKEEYFDLSIRNRDATNDQVTIDSALAAKKYGVAVKCATITPNLERIQEYNLKKMWKSPNATIRSVLDGTVFRAPILIKGIQPYIKSWKEPITLARHAYGDLYRASEMKIDAPGKCELVFTAEDGTETRELIHQFQKPGVVQGIHNLDDSIRSFARCCMTYALDVRQNLVFSAKDTISKVYDRNFREIFKEVFMEEFMERFTQAGITYEYCLIDDAVSKAVKNPGGYVWACQNYDGDVMSDMLATAYGSAAMMTSVLVSPDGNYEYEAAHGTVRRHYYRYLEGGLASTNPLAIILAWSSALTKRGELDHLKPLVQFGQTLQRVTIETVEQGIMTADLQKVTTIPDPHVVTGLKFIDCVQKQLKKYYS
ncbi:MAG: NADP-dependent isocitrate dehydrogenase [Lachnospiraceae bacterium]